MIGKRASIAAVSVAVLGLPALARADVVVSTGSTANMTCTGGVCSPTARKAVLNVSDLAAMLASGDVTIQSGALAQDIAFNAPLSWTSPQRLTLDAYRSIRFEKPIVAAGTGALTIATNDGGSGGDFRFTGKGHVEFRDVHSSLIINANPYVLVSSMRQLQRVLNPKLAVHYVALVKSIDLGRTTYSRPPVHYFYATLEGLGNSISNLTINDSTLNDIVGIFYYCGSDKANTIRDVNLLSVNIVASEAGQSVGTFSGVTGTTTIENVHVSGSITASGIGATVSALVGSSARAIVNSQADVAISAGNSARAGGLVGAIGDSSGLILDSFSTGSVSVSDDSSVGGLAGDNVGAFISNSYSLASVTGGANASAGGLVGMQEEALDFPTLQNVYSSSGVVAGPSSSVGGLIGTDIAGSSNSDSYWDLDTSGVSDPSKGAGNIANDSGLTGLTTIQFQSGLPAGFDTSVWRESATDNAGFPYLIGNPPR